MGRHAERLKPDCGVTEKKLEEMDVCSGVLGELSERAVAGGNGVAGSEEERTRKGTNFVAEILHGFPSVGGNIDW